MRKKWGSQTHKNQNQILLKFFFAKKCIECSHASNNGSLMQSYYEICIIITFNDENWNFDWRFLMSHEPSFYLFSSSDNCFNVN